MAKTPVLAFKFDHQATVIQGMNSVVDGVPGNDQSDRREAQAGGASCACGHGEPGSIGACGGESTWWRRDSIIYDCAKEETSPKIRVRTLKLLSFPIDLADGGAYVEGL